jgi:DNA/RNA endonuclease G (NUC1)
VIGALSVGCAPATRSVRVAIHSALTVPTAAADPTLIAKHCPLGEPQKLPSLDHGPTTVVTREAYALEHDSLSKIALWVCGSLDPTLVFGDAERKNNWIADPDLTGPRAADADYKNSGFQRGKPAEAHARPRGVWGGVTPLGSQPLCSQDLRVERQRTAPTAQRVLRAEC